MIKTILEFVFDFLFSVVVFSIGKNILRVITIGKYVPTLEKWSDIIIAEFVGILIIVLVLFGIGYFFFP